MKNKITNILDGIFSFILFYLVFFALTKRLAPSPIPTLASVDLALITQSVYLFASIKKRENAKEKENMRNFFIFTNTNAQSYLGNALSARYETKLENNRLTVGNTFVYTALTLSPLSYQAVVDAFKARTSDKIVILCFSYDKKAYRLAQSLPCDISILDENSVYNLLKSLDALPSFEVQISRKYPLKNLLSDIANAKLSNRLLFSALVLTLFSFLTPFRNYYAIFALFLLLLAIIPRAIKLITQK